MGYKVSLKKTSTSKLCDGAVPSTVAAPTECPLLVRIRDEKRKAMLAREREKVDAITSILAAVQNKEVDEQIKVTDAMVMQIIGKLINLVKESIDTFAAADRADQVAKLQFEMNTLSSFLPQQLTAEEVLAIVEESVVKLGAVSVKDMGKVMANIKPKLSGRTDMSQLGEVIKKRLSSGGGPPK